MVNKLIKNTGIYFIVGFSAQAVIFLLWIILARILTPSQIGLYALVLFVIEFFGVLSIFGLSVALPRFYYTKESISSIFNNALVIFLVSSFLSLLLFFFTVRFISLIIPGLSNILEKNLFLFGVVIFANSLANFGLYHYTALKKAVSFAKLHLSKIILFAFLSLVFVQLGLGIIGVFYALFISSFLIAILFLIQERKIISFQMTSLRITKNITSYGFPLMLYGAFGVVTIYFSRLLLDRYTNLATLGVYSFFLILTLQVDGLWSSFNRAWTPEIFSKFSEDKEKAIENVKFVAFFSSFIYLLAFIFFIILGESFLFKFMFKEIYFLNRYLLYILLLGPLFTGVYTAAYPLYYYQKKTRIILSISIFISVMSLLFTFFMVRFLGQTGAALSFFGVSIMSSLAYLIVFKNIASIPKEIIHWALFLAGFMILSVAIFLQTSSNILFLLFIISGAILAYKLGNLSEKKYLLTRFFKKNH